MTCPNAIAVQKEVLEDRPKREVESHPPDGPIPGNLLGAVKDKVRMAFCKSDTLQPLRGPASWNDKMHEVPTALEGHRGKPKCERSRCFCRLVTEMPRLRLWS